MALDLVTHSGFGVETPGKDPFLQGPQDLVSLGMVYALQAGSDAAFERDGRHLALIAGEPQVANYQAMGSGVIEDLRRKLEPVLSGVELQDSLDWVFKWTLKHFGGFFRVPSRQLFLELWTREMAKHRACHNQKVYQTICEALGIQNVSVVTSDGFFVELAKDPEEVASYEYIYAFLQRFLKSNKKWREELSAFVPSGLKKHAEPGRSKQLSDYNVHMFAMWLYQACQGRVLVTHEKDARFLKFLSQLVSSNEFEKFISEEDEFESFSREKLFCVAVFEKKVCGLSGLEPCDIKNIGICVRKFKAAFERGEPVAKLRQADFVFRRSVFGMENPEIKRALTESLAETGFDETFVGKRFWCRNMDIDERYGDRTLLDGKVHLPYNVKDPRDRILVTDSRADVENKLALLFNPDGSRQTEFVRGYVREIVTRVLAATYGKHCSPTYDVYTDSARIVDDLMARVLEPIHQGLKKGGLM